MKLGRLILTHREDLVHALKNFYLGQKRTDFLVIAHNWKTVDPRKFETGPNFKLVPYYGPSNDGNISGMQWRVWVDVAKQFSGVAGWVIHDYDFLCRPSDIDIFTHVQEDTYGMIGRAFPVWQEGMKDEDVDTYPFPQDHRHWHNVGRGPIDIEVDETLMNAYPYYYQGTKTVLGGYSDFLAVSSRNILLLDDVRIVSLKDVGGLEQVPHTVWSAKGITPVDMRQFYKTKVFMDVIYIPDQAEYDMLNPIKYWPGTALDNKTRIKNLKMKLKRLVKSFIRYQGWRK